LGLHPQRRTNKHKTQLSERNIIKGSCMRIFVWLITQQSFMKQSPPSKSLLTVFENSVADHKDSYQPLHLYKGDIASPSMLIYSPLFSTKFTFFSYWLTCIKLTLPHVGSLLFTVSKPLLPKNYHQLLTVLHRTWHILMLSAKVELTQHPCRVWINLLPLNQPQLACFHCIFVTSLTTNS